jgi:prevent-host-death family protein
MAGRSRVGVREVRQNLSVYLDRVKAGESLEITEHGKPVAVLVPTEDTASALRRLIAEGRARPPQRRWAHLPSPVAAAKARGMRSLGDVLRELDADTI